MVRLVAAGLGVPTLPAIIALGHGGGHHDHAQPGPGETGWRKASANNS
jgi:hypothetical protein